MGEAAGNRHRRTPPGRPSEGPSVGERVSRAQKAWRPSSRALGRIWGSVLASMLVRGPDLERRGLPRTSGRLRRLSRPSGAMGGCGATRARIGCWVGRGKKAPPKTEESGRRGVARGSGVGGDQETGRRKGKSMQDTVPSLQATAPGAEQVVAGAGRRGRDLRPGQGDHAAEQVVVVALEVGTPPLVGRRARVCYWRIDIQPFSSRITRCRAGKRIRRAGRRQPRERKVAAPPVPAAARTDTCSPTPAPATPHGLAGVGAIRGLYIGAI